MTDKVTKEQFRELMAAWHMNNGIIGFIDYFFYPHKRSAFYDTPKEMLQAWHDSDQGAVWSDDYYVNEWWVIWETRDLTSVFNRSDGSILDWLHHIIENGSAHKRWEEEE